MYFFARSFFISNQLGKEVKTMTMKMKKALVGVGMLITLLAGSGMALAQPAYNGNVSGFYGGYNMWNMNFNGNHGHNRIVRILSIRHQGDRIVVVVLVRQYNSVTHRYFTRVETLIFGRRDLDRWWGGMNFRDRGNMDRWEHMRDSDLTHLSDRDRFDAALFRGLNSNDRTILRVGNQGGEQNFHGNNNGQNNGYNHNSQTMVR